MLDLSGVLLWLADPELRSASMESRKHADSPKVVCFMADVGQEGEKLQSYPHLLP